MMKRFIFCLCVALAFVACDKEDELLKKDNHDDVNVVSPDDNRDEEMNRLIAQNAKIYSSYKDYIWTVRIESSLEKQLPNSQISWEVWHEKYYEVEDGWEEGYVKISLLDILDDDRYSESTKLINGKWVTEIKFPFYIYYLVIEDVDTYVDCYLFLRTWDAYQEIWQERGYLTEEEQEWILEIEEEYLDKYERECKWYFTFWVCAVIDKYSYPITSFSLSNYLD